MVNCHDSTNAVSRNDKQRADSHKSQSDSYNDKLKTTSHKNTHSYNDKNKPPILTILRMQNLLCDWRGIFLRFYKPKLSKSHKIF